MNDKTINKVKEITKIYNRPIELTDILRLLMKSGQRDFMIDQSGYIWKSGYASGFSWKLSTDYAHQEPGTRRFIAKLAGIKINEKSNTLRPLD